MTLQVDWSKPASHDVASAPHWQVAETVARAVRRYAHEGIGFVLHIHVQDGPDEFRLLIPRMRTYVLVRRSATTLYVERVIFRP